MKVLLLIISLFFSGLYIPNDHTVNELNKFPDVTLKNLEGKSVALSSITSGNKKTIISFWASWCKPCKLELDAIAEIYEEWQEDYDVELVAITIDNARGLAKVPGIVASQDWPFTILSDPNQELQHALNFQTIPQTFVVDKQGNIIYSHNGYTPGDELELEENLKN